MTGFRMAAPLMALREGRSAMAVGLLLALFALSQVFLALPAGRFADRHGLQRPFAISVGIATAGAALAVAFPVFPVLCLTALTCGAATGLAMIALQRHVGRLAADQTQLKQVFSWLAIGPSISNFVGPFAAGLLIDASGFRAAYLLLALLPSLAWFWVRGTVEHEPVAPGQGNPSGSSWNLLRQPEFRRLMLINWMLSSCWDVHTFLVPVLGHERGLSATLIGSILGAFALAATAIRVAMPWLAAHLRESVVIGSAMVATALAVCGLPAWCRWPGPWGPCPSWPGFRAGFGAAHDHEHAAPDHTAAPAWRSAGPARHGHQWVQRGDASAVWLSRSGGRRVGCVLGRGRCGGAGLAPGLADAPTRTPRASPP